MTFPTDVHLDPTKRYYISVLPGDDIVPGHTMGGASIVCTGATTAAACSFAALTIPVTPQLQHAAKVSAFVFEDDHPLNGEHDASGGVDVLSPNEPGLGGFNLTILDLVGGSGDPIGQMTRNARRYQQHGYFHGYGPCPSGAYLDHSELGLPRQQSGGYSDG